MKLPQWFELVDGESVLEFEESPEGALELHVVMDSRNERTLAWWENERGEWLAPAPVGQC